MPVCSQDYHIYKPLINYDIQIVLFREIICDHMIKTLEDNVIGGVGLTVEIDESMFGRAILVYVQILVIFQGRENITREGRLATGSAGS